MNISIEERSYNRIDLGVYNGVDPQNKRRSILVKYITHFLPTNKKLCLLTLDTSKTSIVHEFSHTVNMIKKREIIFETELYQTVTLDKLSEKDLILLIEESEFYLGYLIIGIINVGLEDDFINKMTELEFGKNDIRNYVLDYECIFMEDDGEVLYWTNPNFSLDQSRKFINTLSDIK